MSDEKRLTFILGGRNEQTVRQEQLEELIKLQQELGFVETQQMIGLRKQFVVESDNREKLCTEWIVHAEQELKKLPEGDMIFANATIGMHIAQARLYLEAGLTDYFFEKIEDVLMYAEGLGTHGLCMEIESIRDKK